MRYDALNETMSENAKTEHSLHRLARIVRIERTAKDDDIGK